MTLLKPVPDWREKVDELLERGELHVHQGSVGLLLLVSKSFICIDEPERCYKRRVRAEEPRT